MRIDVLRGLVAMEEIFTYKVAPAEFVEILKRSTAMSDREASVIFSIIETLDKHINK